MSRGSSLDNFSSGGIFFGIFLLSILLSFTRAFDVKSNFLVPTLSEDHSIGAIDCLNGTLSLTPEFTDRVKECLPGLSQQYGHNPGQKNPQCALFCQGHACNLLGEDNLPSNDLYKVFVDVAILDHFRHQVRDHVADCFSKFGAQVSLTDESCEGAQKFNSCIFEIFQYKC